MYIQRLKASWIIPPSEHHVLFYSCQIFKILLELCVFVCLTVCCVLHQDKETGFHRGFCWIGFTTEEGLNNALQKDPHVLEGAKVKVKWSQSSGKVLWVLESSLTQHSRSLDRCSFFNTWYFTQYVLAMSVSCTNLQLTSEKLIK